MYEDKLIAVLTPTYNRAHTLPKLYESLCEQTSGNFVWVVVDDGSDDNTGEYIKKIIDDGNIPIIYYHKENAGKHTALNYGIERTDNELTFIVDSDDYLIPEAVETIGENWKQFRANKRIAGISFLKGYTREEQVGDKFSEECVCSYIEMRLKRKVGGDKAEVFRTELLKERKFPEIKGEKFIGEDYVWCDIGKYYDMVWKNDIIYICEYLEDGLTKSGRAMRIKCPVGGMLNSAMMLTKEFPVYFRIKKAILYNCYYYFSDGKQRKAGKTEKGKIIRFITAPAGYLLYRYWKKKYL
ncbi:MAG: glycosyltransferase family 2 protein [Oscillospiraceae bacterium]|nr:glycosyltransferase family 2 protein [Oscillospiraceae bacterium]